MRISKVYTRTGDEGKTRLAGGQEVWKDSLRVEAYGTVDELNSVVGIIRMSLHKSDCAESLGVLKEVLSWIQHKLFDIGGILAIVPGKTFPNMPVIADLDIASLEKTIDECQKDLAPLKEFILPGGGEISAYLHLARTICRRAERVCVKLSREEEVDPGLIKFINRLSDAFFVLARWVAKVQGEPEFLWERSRTC